MTRFGYEVYQLYLAMQRHFSTDYDFFKYNGKVNASTDAYQKRSDMYSFEKITKIIERKDLEDFFLSHFLEDPKCWIRNMSKIKMEQYKAHIKNMPSKFREDCYTIKRSGPGECMKVSNNSIPLIHKKCIDGEINIESLVLLNQLYSFISQHEALVDLPFVWPDHLRKLKNYSPFVLKKLDYKYYEDIARDVFMS